MKMNINRISSANAVGIYRKNRNGVHAPQNKTTDKDALVLSKDGQIFTDALNAVKAMPETRDAKINEIKSSIKNGSYNVSSSEIADRIIKGFKFDQFV